MFQVIEGKKYGVLQFLGENLVETTNCCILLIMKHNMGWKESIYKKVFKETQSIKNKIFGMHEELHKDMNIVNSIGFLQFDDGNMDSEALPKSFNGAIANIKDNEMPTTSDFTTLANIESMLYLKRNLMSWQSMKIK